MRYNCNSNGSHRENSEGGQKVDYHTVVTRTVNSVPKYILLRHAQYTQITGQFKAQIFERGGVSGLRSLRGHLERMDSDGSGFLERFELSQGLRNFEVDADDGPGGDVEKIMGFFDRDGAGRIDIREFHRGLRVRSWCSYLQKERECGVGVGGGRVCRHRCMRLHTGEALKKEPHRHKPFCVFCTASSR